MRSAMTDPVEKPKRVPGRVDAEMFVLLEVDDVDSRAKRVANRFFDADRHHVVTDIAAAMRQQRYASPHRWLRFWNDGRLLAGRPAHDRNLPSIRVTRSSMTERASKPSRNVR